jgi:hypothetical protein
LRGEGTSIEEALFALDPGEFDAMLQAIFRGPLIRQRPSSALLSVYIDMRFSFGRVAIILEPSLTGLWRVIAAVPEPSWLRRVVGLMENDPNAWIVHIEPVGIVVAIVSRDRAEAVAGVLLRMDADH